MVARRHVITIAQLCNAKAQAIFVARLPGVSASVVQQDC